MWTTVNIVFCCFIIVWATETRLLEHARAFYENAAQIISESNEQRFMFEESPHYETGYLVFEIIDRYKKMVLHTLRINDTQFRLVKLDFYDALEPTEQIQSLYLELYHLCNMVHEIPRKWIGHYHGISGLTKVKGSVNPFEAEYKKRIKQRERDRKQRLKDLKKFVKSRLEDYISGKVSGPPSRIPRVTKEPYWPIDYGWEPETHDKK